MIEHKCQTSCGTLYTYLIVRCPITRLAPKQNQLKSASYSVTPAKSHSRKDCPRHPTLPSTILADSSSAFHYEPDYHAVREQLEETEVHLEQPEQEEA